MRILYVENHSVFARNVVRQFLARHSVTIVPSLAEARAAGLGSEFDILLVDFDLDDGKGDTLVRELRESGNQTKIIAVSSHEDGNSKLLNAGATTVCSKMNFDEIQTVIDKIMQEAK